MGVNWYTATSICLVFLDLSKLSSQTFFYAVSILNWKFFIYAHIHCAYCSMLNQALLTLAHEYAFVIVVKGKDRQRE